MFPTNLPHVGSVEIRLRDAKDDQSGHDSDQLNGHQPPNGLSRQARPFSENDFIGSGLCWFVCVLL